MQDFIFFYDLHSNENSELLQNQWVTKRIMTFTSGIKLTLGVKNLMFNFNLKDGFLWSSHQLHGQKNRNLGDSWS